MSDGERFADVVAPASVGPVVVPEPADVDAVDVDAVDVDAVDVDAGVEVVGRGRETPGRMTGIPMR